MSNKTKVYGVVFLLIFSSGLMIFLYAYKYQQESLADTLRTSVNVVSTTYKLNMRTKTANCKVTSGLPDPACTPGAVLTTDKKIICRTSSVSIRNLTLAATNAAYNEYKIRKPANNTGSNQKYDVDRLIPLILGGSDNIANLWPQAATPMPGFHEKNKVETYLHDLVCSGKMSVEQAQFEIATNWVKYYQLTLPATSNDNLMHKIGTTTESTSENVK